ncbi:hypothetical protein [Billgrantia bachuensis]|uniref:Minor tail protein n=1 Tax=Billgrantia bachuensis TaxID=2717286 RepID=A0ABX0PSP3_9GAMM|nr:hypothetical protein [Halomonas bachuensis]NIC05263.1 hypothetical protein [Halomonas bachuensis]
MAQVPTRELIFQALADKLGAHRARADIDKRDLPARVLWSGEDGQVERDQYGAVSVTTGASLIAQHPADADSDKWDAQGNAILAQVIADATAADRTLGGLAEDLTYTATAILYPDTGSSIITVGVDLAVRWTHPVGNPFTEVPD